MEYNKIETLLEKYFDGLTSIAEEKELTNYFSSPNVAQHLQQYQSIFKYCKQAKSEKFVQEIPLIPKGRDYKKQKVVRTMQFNRTKEKPIDD